MAITLGALALGYFYGGRLSAKTNTTYCLMLVLIAAALFMMLMPFLVGSLFVFAKLFSLIPALVISGTLLLLPPVFLMGMVSPLIIKNLTTKAEDSGKRAGEVYAVSTLGGIITTFLTGFYLIPAFGLKIPLLIFAGVQLILPVYFLVQHKKNTSALLVLIFTSLFSYKTWATKNTDTDVLYSQDGLLGKVEVLNYIKRVDSSSEVLQTRMLLMNNIIQTWTGPDGQNPQLEYARQIEDNVSEGKNKKALLLGLGGGTVATILNKKGYKVTAVELDERMVEVARSYFSLNKNVKVIVDDARHGIQNLHEKYGVVMVDLFSAEVSPSHVLSKESLEQLSLLMNKQGLLIINTYGYLQKPAGKGNLALIRTLKECGFRVSVCATDTEEKEDYRNIVIYASQQVLPALNQQIHEALDLSDAAVITDDFPALEYLNAEAAQRWRFAYLRNFILVRP